MIVNESLPLEKQHQYETTYEDSKRIPEVFMEDLDPIFIRLSNYLLSRCQKEWLKIKMEHWVKCSKTKFFNSSPRCL